MIILINNINDNNENDNYWINDENDNSNDINDNSN